MRLSALALLAATTLLGAPLAAAAQGPVTADSMRRAGAHARCRNPADPRRRPQPCNTGRESAFDKEEHTLARDWGGARGWMMRHGITPTLSLTAQPMVSDVTVAGGRGWSWVNQANLGIAVDLGTVASAGDWQLYIGMAYASGPSLSDKIGSLFTVQSAASGYGFWAGEVYLQKTVDDGRLTFAVGRLASSPSFTVLPVSYNYLNSAIAWGNPNALGIDDASFTGFPVGIQWGGQAVYQLWPTIELGLGLYNNDPHAAAGYEHGFHLSLQDGNVGALAVAEVSWLRNQGKRDRGLPGRYSLGGYYDGNRFATLPSGADTVAGMHNVYAMFEQLVTRPGGPGSDRGLTVWGAVSWTDRTTVARMPWSMNAGVSAEGPFRARERDVISFGAYYGSVSRAIPGAGRELALELNYQLVVRRWFTVTPDLQYISRPGGTSSSLPSATLLGVQLLLVF